jgi:hypothetical protein
MPNVVGVEVLTAVSTKMAVFVPYVTYGVYCQCVHAYLGVSVCAVYFT